MTNQGLDAYNQGREDFKKEVLEIISNKLGNLIVKQTEGG